MFVNIMCNMQDVTIFSENFLNEWRKLSQSVLIIQLYVACSPQTANDRRRKAYRLSQMIKRSFQHIDFFLAISRCPKMSI